ncbi:hypothetical protein GQX74_000247 [Glossina fuscipes]|nr:hypothetical protein GQX74_000247 [Glossina fuscipes]
MLEYQYKEKVPDIEYMNYDDNVATACCIALVCLVKSLKEKTTHNNSNSKYNCYYDNSTPSGAMKWGHNHVMKHNVYNPNTRYCTKLVTPVPAIVIDTAPIKISLAFKQQTTQRSDNGFTLMDFFCTNAKNKKENEEKIK